MFYCDKSISNAFFYTLIFLVLINYRPEALGIVPGAIFLICLTFCLVGYATSHPTKVSHLLV